MKALSSSLLLLILLTACNNNKSSKRFRMEAQVTDVESGDAILYLYNTAADRLDTLAFSKINNGLFVFDSASIKWDGPAKLILLIKPTAIEGKMSSYAKRNLIVEDMPQTLEVSLSSSLCYIPESKYNDRIINIDKQYPELNGIRDSISVITKMFREDFSDEERRTKLSAIQESISELEASYAKLKSEKIVEEFAESKDYVHKSLLLDVFSESIEPEVYITYAEEVLEHIDKEMLTYSNIIYEKETYERLLQVAVDRPYKDISLKDSKDKLLKLSDVISENNYVLLDFWATWCGPCTAEMPALRKAYNQYNEKGFEIFMVSIDKSYDAWHTFNTEENFPWVSTLAREDDEINAQSTYSVNAIPANFLIDSKGIIVARNLSGEALITKLEELIGEIDS